MVYHHIGKQVLNNEIARAAMTVSTLFVVTYVVGALVGIAHGYDATASIAESVAMASNGGLSFGITTQGMPKTLELIYILEMWAGRLEFSRHCARRQDRCFALAHSQAETRSIGEVRDTAQHTERKEDEGPVHFGEGARCCTLWATRICPGLWREATYSFVGSTCVLFGALVRSRFSGVG